MCYSEQTCFCVTPGRTLNDSTKRFLFCFLVSCSYVVCNTAVCRSVSMICVVWQWSSDGCLVKHCNNLGVQKGLDYWADVWYQWVSAAVLCLGYVWIVSEEFLCCFIRPDSHQDVEGTSAHPSLFSIASHCVDHFTILSLCCVCSAGDSVKLGQWVKRFCHSQRVPGVVF